MQYLTIAILVLALAVWLVLRSRRERGVAREPYRPSALAGPLDVERAYTYVRDRLAEWPDLDPDAVRRILAWCSEYVRAHTAPMNGGGPRDGWLMPPNMFDVVEHVQLRTREHGIEVDQECLWVIAGAHDEFLRSDIGR